MAKPCLSLMATTPRREIVNLVRSCRHHGFPVVDADGRLRGLVLREQLFRRLRLGHDAAAVNAYAAERRYDPDRATRAQTTTDHHGGPYPLPTRTGTRSVLDSGRYSECVGDAHADAMRESECVRRKAAGPPPLATVPASPAQPRAAGRKGPDDDDRNTLLSAAQGAGAGGGGSSSGDGDSDGSGDEDAAAAAIDAAVMEMVMDRAPCVVSEEAPLSRVHAMFRALGLRHLVVLSRDGRVVGIITRKDLARVHRRLAAPKARKNFFRGLLGVQAGSGRGGASADV